MRIQSFHRRIWGRLGGGHKAGLVVELDGSVHDKQIEEDAQRDKVLKETGLRIVRFRNEGILKDLPAVLGQIFQNGFGVI